MEQNIGIEDLFNIDNRRDLLGKIKSGVLKNSNIDNIFNITVLEDIINRFSQHYYLKEHGIEKVNDELAIILDNIFNSLSVNRKNEIINELKEIEKNIIYNGKSINLITKNNHKIPFLNLIKMKLLKPLEVFLEQGYLPSENESLFFIQKSLKKDLDPKYINLIKEPNNNEVFEALEKEIMKYGKKEHRSSEIMNNLLYSNEKVKELFFNIIESDRSKDRHIPYFITNERDKNTDGSLITKLIMMEDLNGIHFLLSNGFKLNLKEYSLMYLPLRELEKKEEPNFADKGIVCKSILTELDKYPLEYKKELVLNISRHLCDNFSEKKSDLLFMIKDILAEVFDTLNERERFEMLGIKQNYIAPLMVYMLNKEAQEYFLLMFGSNKYDLERMSLKIAYKNSLDNIFKDEYKEIFNQLMNSYTIDKISQINEEIKNDNKSDDYMKKLSVLLENHILKESFADKNNVTNKKLRI